MNIFDLYLEKIKKMLLDLSKDNNLILPENLDGITVETPPKKFDSDISTNVAMVLSKINKKSPAELSQMLIENLKKRDEFIENVAFANPGFINITFKPIFWTNFIEKIINNSKTFGVNQNENLSKLVVKPANASGGYGIMIGPKASSKEREELLIMSPKAEQYILLDFF